MKKKFVFDSMESDFSDIKEETIIENTGVNTERVVKTVMEATAAKKIVGAAGGFNKAFGNWFAGQPKYGLFAGSNVSVKSDKLDIDFQGIAGEDDFVGAVMDIKSKDGSAFFEKNDGNYLIYGSNDVDVTLSPLAALFGKDPNRNGSVWYKEKDENTIQVTAFYGDPKSNIKGERMTVKEKELYILHLDEAVGTYTDEYDDLMAKYKNKLGKDQTIFEYSKSGAYEDNIYYIVTEKKVSFEFELGVTLNYKTYSRTMNDLNGKQFSMNDVTMTINNICAKSFGLEVDATVSPIPYPEMPDLWLNLTSP